MGVEGPALVPGRDPSKDLPQSLAAGQRVISKAGWRKAVPLCAPLQWSVLGPWQLTPRQDLRPPQQHLCVNATALRVHQGGRSGKEQSQGDSQGRSKDVPCMSSKTLWTRTTGTGPCCGGRAGHPFGTPAHNSIDYKRRKTWAFSLFPYLNGSLCLLQTRYLENSELHYTVLTPLS